MISSIQYETIRQQCRSFDSIPLWRAELTINNHDKLSPHLVLIETSNNMYRLADPDPGVIIQQLCHLYGRARSEQYDNIGAGRA